MIYEDTLSALRRHVAQAFKAGTSTFPHYTLHGEEHLAELDRLALLIGGHIPRLAPDRLNLLRLALILHDFAMVDVPTPPREEELRQQMGPDLSFADIVRKTHQDEIDRSWTKPERISLLMGLIPTAGSQDVDDACTIARHHRLHPLDQAPEHVQDLCALMRVLDELDIGPNRAPLPAYEALRPRMDSISRFHWLKHICTRAVVYPSLFQPEERKVLRSLKVLVAVKATEKTWRPIQAEILSKLRHCLEKEGVNDVLRDNLGVELEVGSAPEPSLSGVQLFLPLTVQQDLDSIPEVIFSKASTKQPRLPTASPPSHSAVFPSGSANTSPERSLREFKIIALPPEKLAETLCLGGRLTVIGNRYVAPAEETAGGTPGAPNRVYVGPADCGKTRAALEWVSRLTEGKAAQWVVLRTDRGTLPATLESIVLDTSRYEEQQYLIPQKAILFLDDLPANLPPPSDALSADDAVRVLFRWFQEQSYFHERRLVGTLRLEDTRPEWPEVLPNLGQTLELIRLLPLGSVAYRELWEGMTTGAVSRSISEGISPFHLTLPEGFVDSVSQRPADPEAVAVFVQQNALKTRTELEVADAERFSESAVKTWISETWPALFGAYGLAVKVFFTLVRFFEAALRPASGFHTSIGPEWQAHEAFGPELCAASGATQESYLPCLRRLIEDGHASGKIGEWIRPRADFLLQANVVSELEVSLPSSSWFAERCKRLRPDLRRSLALQFGMSQNCQTEFLPEDSSWLGGLGGGLGRLAEFARTKGKKSELLDSALSLIQAAIEKAPNDFMILSDLGMALSRRAELLEMGDERLTLEQNALAANRRATDANPQSSQAWNNLGVSLGQKADREENPNSRDALREEEIAAYRRATDADPQNSQAWNNLGVRLSQKADREENPHSRGALRDEQIAAYRRAADAAHQTSSVWNRLSVALVKHGRESQDSQLFQEALEAARRAVSLGARHYNLACILALTGEHATALLELQGCLEREEITREHVLDDPDWDDLREDPRFLRILEAPK